MQEADVGYTTAGEESGSRTAVLLQFHAGDFIINGRNGYDERQPRRLFILDPVCALPFGHNVNALHYYHEHFEAMGLEVRSLSSRLLPEALTKGRVEREFSFLYEDSMDVSSVMTDAERELSRTARTANDRIALATGEMRAFLTIFDIGPDDVVFFPSIDFFSLIAFLHATMSAPDRAPVLWARFIGVLEHHASGIADARARMLREMKRAAHTPGRTMRLSAETPTLAASLTAALDFPVETAPYPLAHDPVPMELDGPLVVLAAGSARFDKGYKRLAAIYEEVRKVVPLGRFEFIVQAPPDDVLVQALDETSRLYRLPHVHVLPAVLSQSMMMRCYARAHVVIMPYDTGVYRERGSAVMQEAVALGRYVVGQRGTGFAPQIVDYGIGLLAQSDIDFGAQIARIATLPRAELASIAAEGRARYAADADRVYRSWLQ